MEHIKIGFQDLPTGAETELQLCMTMTSTLSEQDKWMCLLDQPEHREWYAESFDAEDRFKSILPWFDAGHQWKAMPTDIYLVGGADSCGGGPHVFEDQRGAALSMLEDCVRLTAMVAELDIHGFVEFVRVDLYASK